jgi:hypothetical protein
LIIVIAQAVMPDAYHHIVKIPKVNTAPAYGFPARGRAGKEKRK